MLRNNELGNPERTDRPATWNRGLDKSGKSDVMDIVREWPITGAYTCARYENWSAQLGDPDLTVRVN